MRLTDIDPRWIELDGHRIGFCFLCPTPITRSDGTVNPTPYRQSCFTAHVARDLQHAIFDRMFGDDSYTVQRCNPECAWTVDGGIDAASFETLSVSPSIDGSAAGFWHGFIKNGAIT
jgi:hypothetical protein